MDSLFSGKSSKINSSIEEIDLSHMDADETGRLDSISLTPAVGLDGVGTSVSVCASVVVSGFLFSSKLFN